MSNGSLMSVDENSFYNTMVPIVCPIIIIINLTVVFSCSIIIHKKKEPQSTYIFMGNIALSDLFIGISSLVDFYYPVDMVDEIWCTISIGMSVVGVITSISTIGLIGIDRFLYIFYGFQYKRYVTTMRAYFSIFITWIFAIIMAFLPACFQLHIQNIEEMCWFTLVVPPKVVVLLSLVGFLPFALIFVLYGIILKRTLDRISLLNSCESRSSHNETQFGNLRVFRGGTSSRVSVVSLQDHLDGLGSIHEPKRRVPRCFQRKSHFQLSQVYCVSKWKAIKVVAFTTGVFFVTWCPYLVACCLYVSCRAEYQPNYCENLRLLINNELYFLGMCNSLMNPIIYAWWHNGFRESAKKIFRRILCLRSQKLSKDHIQKQNVYSGSYKQTK